MRSLFKAYQICLVPAGFEVAGVFRIKDLRLDNPHTLVFWAVIYSMSLLSLFVLTPTAKSRCGGDIYIYMVKWVHPMNAHLYLHQIIMLKRR